jgi:hypothetical protein
LGLARPGVRNKDFRVADWRLKLQQAPWQTEPMRILINFRHRSGWSIHCLAPDCKTLVSPWLTVQEDETLLRVLAASGATPAQLDEVVKDMRRWGRGSTFIEVNDAGRRLLRIK